MKIVTIMANLMKILSITVIVVFHVLQIQHSVCGDEDDKPVVLVEAGNIGENTSVQKSIQINVSSSNHYVITTSFTFFKIDS